MNKEEILWRKMFDLAVKVDETLFSVVKENPDDKDIHIALQKVQIIFQILLSDLVRSKRISPPAKGLPNGNDS